MNSQSSTLDLGDETSFSTISRPTLSSQNAYNQLPLLPGQVNMSRHHFLSTMHGSPPLLDNSDFQFNEPSCNNVVVQHSNHPSHANFLVRPDKPPSNFNFYALPNRPPPFTNVNPMPNEPPPLNFNAMYNRPPQFSNFNDRPNGPPPCATSYSKLNRPPPLVDTSSMETRTFQTKSNGRPVKPPISDPFTNSSNWPPFLFNRPPTSQVCFNDRIHLPPPNANCYSSEFKTNVLSNVDPSRNIRNATCSDLFPRQQPPLSSDGLIHLQSQLPTPPLLPSTEINSFLPVASCRLSLPISYPLHSQRPSRSEHTSQPFQSSDGSARQFSTSSTLQHQHPSSHVSLHRSREFSKDPSCPAVCQTHLKAVPSCSAAPPSRLEKAGDSFSDTTRTRVASTLVIPFHPLHHQVISFKKDQDWVIEWLEEKGKQQMKSQNAAISDNCSKDYADSRRAGQITTNKDDWKAENISKLADVHSLVAKYTMLLKTLRQCYHTKDEEMIASVKVELNEISSQLLDPCYQSAVQRLVAARRTKRIRAKHSRQVRLERWQARSRDMDQQRELLCSHYRAEERQKRLLAEVDAVLCEVRGKKEDTVSLQLLLATLRDLRQHRLNKGDQQGYVASQHHTEHFEKVTEGLDEMLESQLQDYELEERTLRAMLEQQRGSDQLSKVLNAMQGDESDHATQITSLREGLFGCATPADPALFASYTAADTSREMLLSRRRAWDKNLVEVGGSGIPISWITPPRKASGAWEKWRVQS